MSAIDPKQLADGLGLLWPDCMTFDRAQLQHAPPHIAIDEDAVNFTGANGSARYLIDKEKSNEHEWVIRKATGSPSHET